MQTIPDEVLERMLQHRPHLATMIANLRAYPAQAPQIETAIAQTFLAGTPGDLSATEVWYLAQVAYGGPWGGAWCRLTEAAILTGYDEAHLRRLAAGWEREDNALKCGKTWYVRRSALVPKERPADA